MKYIFLLLFTVFPILTFGQNLNIKLDKIDSIVKMINDTQDEFSEGIVEGQIVYKGWFKKDGGWGAYYLYNEQKNNELKRIRYNLALRKSYESYEFYYLDGKLVFAKLNVTYYRKKFKSDSFERNYYFQNSELIFDSKSHMEKYQVDYIIKTERSVWKLRF